MEDDEKDRPRSKKNWQSFLASVNRHYKSISFVLIVICGSYLLEPSWHVDQGTPPPSHFSVLVLHKQEDSLHVHGYPFYEDLEKTIGANQPLYSFILPPDAEKKYAFVDTDTFFSIDRISEQEQIVTLDYEIAMMNHGTSKYRVTANNVEPISAEQTTVVLLLTFFAWLVFIAIYVVIGRLWLLTRPNPT